MRGLQGVSVVLVLASDIKMAPRSSHLPEPGQPTREAAVHNSTAPEPHPSTGEPPRPDQDERPHACNDGWVTLGQTVIDPDTGEETEEFALYLCRRCADNR
jgi:hypothetical protein